MTTIKRMKALILFVAVFGGLTLSAQAPQQQMMQQEQTDIEVKDAELEQFVTVSENVMKINQERQQEMLNEIEKEGLTGERYTELRMAEQNPAAVQSEPSKEELDKKRRVDEKLQKIEQKTQQEQVAIVEDSGLSLERYQEIAQAVQSDQELNQKFQKMIMELEE